MRSIRSIISSILVPPALPAAIASSIAFSFLAFSKIRTRSTSAVKNGRTTSLHPTAAPTQADPTDHNRVSVNFQVSKKFVTDSSIDVKKANASLTERRAKPARGNLLGWDFLESIVLKSSFAFSRCPSRRPPKKLETNG